MFEFSLKNGKRQLKGGLICLILNVVAIVIFIILSNIIKDVTGLLVINILFAILIGISGLLALIKLVFGIVVYHAERTSVRNQTLIENEEKTTIDSKLPTKIKFTKITKTSKNSVDESLIKKIEKILPVKLESELEKIKLEDKKIKPVILNDWYISKSKTLEIYLSNNHVYKILNIDNKILKEWNKVPFNTKTMLFYNLLIDKSIICIIDSKKK